MTPKNSKSKNIHQCEICGKKVYGSKYHLNSHLFQHKLQLVKPNHKCSYCLKEFYRRDEYNRHIMSHRNTRNIYYTCDHCETSFAVKRNLIRHLKVHHDLFVECGKEFCCTACGATYCEQRLLYNHIRKNHFSFHDREPNFIKKKLNETWVEKVNGLESYVEITKINNNVLKIKKCETKKIASVTQGKCDKSDFDEYVPSIFSSKNTTHYSMAVCDYCKKQMVKKSLINHIRERHLKLRQFKCEKCSERFNRHYQMVKHVCGKFKRKERKN